MLLLTVSGNISLTMSFLLSVSHFQLVPYWEKTFRIDLSSPQIGVVDVEDVSHPFPPQIHLSLIIKNAITNTNSFAASTNTSTGLSGHPRFLQKLRKDQPNTRSRDPLPLFSRPLTHPDEAVDYNL